jgi:hypothetical protein
MRYLRIAVLHCVVFARQQIPKQSSAQARDWFCPRAAFWTSKPILAVLSPIRPCLLVLSQAEQGTAELRPGFTEKAGARGALSWKRR